MITSSTSEVFSAFSMSDRETWAGRRRMNGAEKFAKHDEEQPYEQLTEPREEMAIRLTVATAVSCPHAVLMKKTGMDDLDSGLEKTGMDDINLRGCRLWNSRMVRRAFARAH